MVEILNKWFNEVWNNGREETIFEMFAEDGIVHGLVDADGKELRGPKNFLTFHKTFRGAFPDIKISAHEVLREGDKIAAVCEVTGTHLGDQLGFAPTNKPVEISGLILVKLNNEGKISEAWNQFDFMKMYQQLGVLELHKAKSQN